MENLTNFDSFKNKKHGSKVNEGVIKIGNDYIVSDIQIPVSLVNSYIKKIKDETGKNLREMLSDSDVAHRLVAYCIGNYLQIDNLPANIIIGDESSAAVEVQETPAETQTQTQTQPQSQAPAETQPQSQSPAPAQGEATQVQKTAQEIPATEGGEQSQEI